MCIKVNIWKRTSCFVAVAVVISFSTFSSHNLYAAQETPPEKQERKKALSFEDELVEGSTQKPELFYLFQKKNFNYKRLIKLRENFLPEMRKTSEDLQRVRSSN
jgi:hypothetical protein